MSEKKEDFLTSKWRPLMGWMYMAVCMMDMVIFPIVWSLAQVLTKQPLTQWDPLTLRGAGLFHMAMGAVLGVAAYGRTQEKLGGAAGPTMQSSAPLTTDQTPLPPPVQTSPVVIPDTPPQSAAPIPSVVADPSDPPPMSSKMAERMAKFKK
jgi:hypothetical protein